MACGYDALAGAYERHWEPVLAVASRGLLDRLGTEVRGRAVDVGTGAGILAVEAVRRWPAVEVTATDPSSGMVESARRRAARELSTGEMARLSFAVTPADDLRMPDASVDLVLSSFVYQLVPDRPAALREALRVLRPGGRLAMVTWIADDGPFPPADAFEDALEALKIELPDEGEPEPVSGDYRSARAAASELRGAGFSRVSVTRDWLDYTWDATSYLDCKRRMWEAELLASLEDGLRERLLADVRERLGRLRPRDFRWRAPIVYAFGARPAGPGR